MALTTVLALTRFFCRYPACVGDGGPWRMLATSAQR